jgi:hypothetical protein
MCLCEAADLDHSGSVTRENMELLLSDLEMGLSREQAVAIATEAAADNGVAIHYIDLAPRIIEMVTLAHYYKPPLLSPYFTSVLPYAQIV